MKKTLLLSLILIVIILICGCDLFGKDEEIQFPNFRFEELSACSSFANIQTPSSSKSFSSSVETIFYGYNQKQSKLIKQDFSSGSEQWVVNEFRCIGQDCLYLVIGIEKNSGLWGETCYQLVLDLEKGFVYNLTRAFGNKYVECWNCNKTDKGIVVKFNQGIALAKSSGEVEYLTNPEYEDYLSEFYASKSGHIITKYSSDNQYSYKFYPANGGVPIEDQYQLGRLIDNTDVISSASVDYIVNLKTKKKYSFSNAGIAETNIDIDGTLCGTPVFPYKVSDGRYFVKYKTDCGLISHFIPGENQLVISKIEDEELKVEKYKLPDLGMSSSKDIVIIGDYLIFNKGTSLFYCNYKTGKYEEIGNSISNWGTSGNGIVFTKYISATSVETDYFNLDTMICSKLSDSTLSVSAVSYFYY